MEQRLEYRGVILENLVNASLVVHGGECNTEHPTPMCEEVLEENLVCNSENPSREVEST